MRISIIVITVTLMAILAYSIFDLRADSAAPAAAQGWFDHEAGVLEQRVDALCKAIEQGQPTARLQAAFREARLAYKPIELLAAYYMPYTNKFINGPNIPEVEPDEKHVI